MDLGGTNIRVCSVDLHGDTTFSVQQSKMTIPRQLMVTKTGHQLLSFIAERVEAFLNTYHPTLLTKSSYSPTISLGLTFSFPVYQSAVNSGILLRWTKGFDIPDLVGQDVCKLLQHEIDLRQLPVRVTALVNDAAGTIMSRAYTLPVASTRTSMGAIFGTGTNCVYLERLCNIVKPLEGSYDPSTGEMFISTEWGSFDNRLSVLPNTQFDVELDKVSLNPGDQMFEKRVAGMFLGELLRIIAAQMHTDPEINLFSAYHSIQEWKLNGHQPSLLIRWSVDSSILSVAEADNSEGLEDLRAKIEAELGISKALVSVEDARAVKIISHAIGKRAARLAGMAVGAVVLKTKRLNHANIATERHDENPINGSDSTNIVIETKADYSDVSDKHPTTDIGVDGSLIQFYPNFEKYMRQAISIVEGIGVPGEEGIRIKIAKDGSSVGAAIIALLASQQGAVSMSNT